jgi:hypothetical protein
MFAELREVHTMGKCKVQNFISSIGESPKLYFQSRTLLHLPKFNALSFGYLFNSH